MELYYAPMEGITGYLHRNVSRAVFPDIDKYMTPFIAANQKGKLSTKEKNDILPDHNKGMYVIPQILTESGRLLSGGRTDTTGIWIYGIESESWLSV